MVGIARIPVKFRAPIRSGPCSSRTYRRLRLAGALALVWLLGLCQTRGEKTVNYEAPAITCQITKCVTKCVNVHRAQSAYWKRCMYRRSFIIGAALSVAPAIPVCGAKTYRIGFLSKGRAP